MTTMRRLAIGAVLPLLIASTRAHGQGSIAGMVYDSLRTNAPLAHATVVLIERGRYATTDARGRFRQFGLIAAHVTLCREEELADLSERELGRRLARAAPAPLTLVFGRPARSGGHGMLLPCTDGAEAFDALRRVVLDTTAVRAHAPHMTLAHPRNPRAPEKVAATYAVLPTPLVVTFAAVAVIEQRAAQPWVVRATISLAARA
jgi:hypothetical protein